MDKKLDDYMNLNHILFCCRKCHSDYVYRLDDHMSIECPNCKSVIEIGVIPFLLKRISLLLKQLGSPIFMNTFLYSRAMLESGKEEYSMERCFTESIERSKEHNEPPLRLQIAAIEFIAYDDSRFLLYDGHDRITELSRFWKHYECVTFEDTRRMPSSEVFPQGSEVNLFYCQLAELSSLLEAYNAEYSRLMESGHVFFVPLPNNKAISHTP